MKKAALFLLTIGMILCAGCASPGGDFAVTETAQKLSSELPFAEPLTPLETDVALRLYEIAPEDVQEAAVYVGTGGASVDEISIWKAPNREAAARIETAVKERVRTQKDVYADYRPEQVPKLDQAVLITQGNTVVLCVSGFSSQAREILSAYVS